MGRNSRSSLPSLSPNTRTRINAELFTRHLSSRRLRSGSHLSTDEQPRTPLHGHSRTLPFFPQTAHPFISNSDLSKHKDRIAYTIQRSWGSATSKKYANGVTHFIKFCNDNQIPPHMILPASEFTLCAFAAATSGIRAGSTIRNDLTAVRAWHISHYVPWNGGLQLSYVLKGADNLTPRSSFRPLRAPVSIKMILLLHEGLDLSSNFDVLTYFAACAAFWGQLRLGEILMDSANPSSATTSPSLSHLSPPNQNGSRTLHLPHTKTANARGELIMLCRQHSLSDPIAALDAHLTMNKLSLLDPLFSYLTTSGDYLYLTKQKFLKRCNSIWSLHQIPHTTGHSFRIGGTTHLLLSKVPPDVVKALGRWSSDSFLRYWRSLDILGPLYTEFLGSSGIGMNSAHA
jgi:hypothetical protein